MRCCLYIQGPAAGTLATPGGRADKGGGAELGAVDALLMVNHFNQLYSNFDHKAITDPCRDYRIIWTDVSTWLQRRWVYWRWRQQISSWISQHRRHSQNQSRCYPRSPMNHWRRMSIEHLIIIMSQERKIEEKKRGSALPGRRRATSLLFLP